jgi:Flp pilus assembly protein TadG
VTAETAVVLPVLLFVLAMAVWVLAAVGAQLRCTDAAGVAARAAARGDAAADVQAAGAKAAPEGALIEVTVGPETVQVTVGAQVRPLGGVLGRLPGLPVTGRAVAGREDRPAAP